MLTGNRAISSITRVTERVWECTGGAGTVFIWKKSRLTGGSRVLKIYDGAVTVFQNCTRAGLWCVRCQHHRSNRTIDFLWCDFCESLINSGALVDNVMWPWAQEAVDQHLATGMLSWVLWSGYEFRGGRRKTLHIFMFLFRQPCFILFLCHFVY